MVSTSQVPTGAMVASPDVHFPDAGGLHATINRVTRKDENVFLDAIGIAEILFGDHMMANLVLLGAAYQAGAIAVSAAAIEKAIALNGVSVDANTQAFRAGRHAVAEPGWIERQRPRRVGAVEASRKASPAARALIDATGAEGELRRRLEVRVPALIAYRDEGYARQYAQFVGGVAAAERAGPIRRDPARRGGGAHALQAHGLQIGEYRALIERALSSLAGDGFERAIKLAALPDIIRGYEDVKLASVERFRQEVRALGF